MSRRTRGSIRFGTLLFVLFVVAAFGFVAYLYLGTPSSTDFLNAGSTKKDTTVSHTAQAVYDKLRSQDEVIEFDVRQHSKKAHDYLADIYELNTADYLGPYLKWSQVSNSKHTMSAQKNALGDWYAHYTVDVSYLNSAKQERAFEKRLKALVKKLKLHGSQGKRKKLKAIHKYIIKHVSYSKSGAKVLHTAYSALCNGKAVCQGYATLFYRLAREAGVRCDIVSGKLNGTAHAWNVVKLGKTWYHVDETSCDTSGQHNKFFLVKGKLPGKGFKMDKEYRKKYFR